MQDVRDTWGANYLGTFFWAEWWKYDMATTISPLAPTTNVNYRYALKKTLEIAQEYGIYVELRMYGVSPSDWLIGTIPFPPYGSWSGVVESEQDWIDIWVSVATELKNYPNAIFCLYDEPTGFESDRQVYFNVGDRAITAMRNAGFNGLIKVHWGFCGDSDWMEKWIDEGHQTYNIVFSNHIYRFHGTFDGIGGATDLTSIRDYMYADQTPGAYPPTGLHYNRVVNELNMPIHAAIGASNGATDNDEYTAFQNALTVLNELGIGYVVFQYFRSDTQWAIQEHTVAIQPPNRVGQALIDAIAAGKT